IRALTTLMWLLGSKRVVVRWVLLAGTRADVLRDPHAPRDHAAPYLTLSDAEAGWAHGTDGHAATTPQPRGDLRHRRHRRGRDDGVGGRRVEPRRTPGSEASGD